MLAPIDKIRSGVNDIMQIVVTTACTLNCSNCTQLLPFRKDYLHMGLECFREAVESLRDWPGVVALFGGNPCSHPQFPELCKILTEVIPEQRRRGLWSNDLLRHGQVAKDTFWPNGRFNLNAHGVARAAEGIRKDLIGKLIPGSDVGHSQHAPILVDYMDVGMTLDEWEGLRENCDINQKWSGAVVEREGRAYGYFCEVAASLDGIRDLNNGIPVGPRWWELSMDTHEFQEQVRHCCNLGCGVPLKLKPAQDSEESYGVSFSMREFTRGSQRVNFTQVGKGSEHTHEVTDYLGRRK